MFTDKDFETLINESLEGNNLRRIQVKNLTYILKNDLVDHVMKVGKLDPDKFMLFMEYLTISRGLCNLGREQEFMPPDVDYTHRGLYYQIVNPPDADHICEVINAYDFTNKYYNQRSYPQKFIYDYIVFEFVWMALYDNAPQDTRMQIVKPIVIEALASLGWEHNEVNNIFTTWHKWTRDSTAKMDDQFDGEQSWNIRAFYQIVGEDAFHVAYYSEEENYPPDFQEYVLEMAEKYGYERVDDNFRAKPIPLPDDIEAIGHHILSDVDNLHISKHGYQVMPLQTIREKLANHDLRLSVLKIKHQLMGSQGEWAKPLVVNGFDLYTQEYWCDDFEYENGDDRFKCVQKQRITEASLNHSHKASFAPGLPVTLVGFILNPNTGELVYLNMVGPYNSVRANWSELMMKKQHYYNGVHFKVATGKDHKPFKGFLPSGMYQMILINHAASPTELGPIHDKFYLLTDNRSDAMPEHFIATLDKFLKIPVLPKWAEYLWVLGRSIGMIEYTGSPNKQVGGTSWTVRRGGENSDWTTLISTAVASKKLLL